MNDEQIRIARIVADKSVVLYDECLEQLRLIGYELMKQHITSNIPKNEDTAVDPFLTLRQGLERLEATKLAAFIKSHQGGYVKVEDLIRIKSDRYC